MTEFNTRHYVCFVNTVFGQKFSFFIGGTFINIILNMYENVIFLIIKIKNLNFLIFLSLFTLKG